MPKALRADHVGEHNTAYLKNREKLLRVGGVCGICGQPVDTSIRDPLDPMSACIDHIIPIAKGGHPSALSNLQLAHRWCNRQKSDKLFLRPTTGLAEQKKIIKNDDLLLHCDWMHFKAVKA